MQTRRPNPRRPFDPDRNVQLGTKCPNRRGSIISRYEENNSRQDRANTTRYVRTFSGAHGPLCRSLTRLVGEAIGDLIRLYFALIHKYIWARERESERAVPVPLSD